MAPSLVEQLLSALQAGDGGDTFVALSARHVRLLRSPSEQRKLSSDTATTKQNDRAQSSRGGLDEVVQSMSKKDKPRLCTGLQATAREAALHLAELL
jgi:hypothetical protein